MRLHRGCAAFGHACYGGHGKRSSASSIYPEGLDPSMVGMEVLPIPYSKLALDKSRSMDTAPDVMRPNNGYALDLAAPSHRTDSRTGELKYAIYAMLRQLLEESAVNRQEQTHQQQQQVVQSLNAPFPHDASNVGDIERK
uniref:Uncharacterized protein n=1 Tax=Anopheles stephensi TaxID=30069 RepID=A0A182Y8M6_ANOST